MTAIGLPDRLGLGAMTLAAVAGPVGFFAEVPSLGVCIVGLPTAIVGVVIDVVILAATFALAMARPGRLRPVLR